MKKFFQSQKGKVSAFVSASVMLCVSSAHAVLPTWATDMGADMGTAVSDAVAAVGPVVIAALVAVITIKMIKRFANKI